MFSLVVGLFALCWLPYHLYFLIMYAFPHLAKSPVIRSKILKNKTEMSGVMFGF